MQMRLFMEIRFSGNLLPKNMFFRVDVSPPMVLCGLKAGKAHSIDNAHVGISELQIPDKFSRIRKGVCNRILKLKNAPQRESGHYCPSDAYGGASVCARRRRQVGRSSTSAAQKQPTWWAMNTRGTIGPAWAGFITNFEGISLELHHSKLYNIIV